MCRCIHQRSLPLVIGAGRIGTRVQERRDDRGRVIPGRNHQRCIPLRGQLIRQRAGRELLLHQLGIIAAGGDRDGSPARIHLAAVSRVDAASVAQHRHLAVPDSARFAKLLCDFGVARLCRHIERRPSVAILYVGSCTRR